MRSPEHRIAHPRAGKHFEDELQLRYMAPGAFTVLPPDENPPDPPAAPEPYRLTPATRRHKNQSFAIIGEVDRSRPNSRSPSPTGRVSPFRGHGFNPSGSRHASPNPSPPPPEDARLTPTNLSPRHISKIPKLKRKGSTLAFGEKVYHYEPAQPRRKLESHLSQSMTNLEVKNVATRPPHSPRKNVNSRTPAFQRLSPIVGSSPEPSQSLSSPSRIPKSRSTPPSRRTSPTRNIPSLTGKPPPSKSTSRTVSRSHSRSQSRNASRETSPVKDPMSPTRIPVKYKNIQAKVNSFNKPKPKVPPKPQVLSDQSEDSSDVNQTVKSKPNLSRKESVNKIRTGSRSNLITKTENNSNNINNNTSDISSVVGKVNKNSTKTNANNTVDRTTKEKTEARKFQGSPQKGDNKTHDSSGYIRDTTERRRNKNSESSATSKDITEKRRNNNDDSSFATKDSNDKRKNPNTDGSLSRKDNARNNTKDTDIGTYADDTNHPPYSMKRTTNGNYQDQPARRSGSPVKVDQQLRQPGSPVKFVDQQTRQPGSPVKFADQQTRQPGSPVKFADQHTRQPGSPVKFADQPTRQTGSPVKFSDQPTRQPGSPVKFADQPTRQTGSPVKFADQQTKQPGSPVKYADQQRRKPGSPVKFANIPPSTTTVVSSTTSTVTQPLKIDANINLSKSLEKPKPMSPMVDGRVLSATSVSNAMNKMNDTVLNTQTVFKEHGFAKLPSAANAAISVGNELGKTNPALDTRNATNALPKVEPMTGKSESVVIDIINNGRGNNHTNHITHAGFGSSKALEMEVQRNMSRLISPEHTMGNSVQRSLNDRMKEARTVVTSDVKPIRITVKEKPSDVEVQSGNVRQYPVGISNGLNERPGLPPSQQTPPNEPAKELPPQNACTRFFSGCRNKMACQCCKKEAEPKDKDDDEEEKAGCLGCMKKKGKREETVRISIEDESENKSKLWDKLKCCNKHKVRDTSCFPTGKRKDSWVERRDSILSDPPQRQNPSRSKCSRDCCKGFFRKMFCVDLCCKKKIQEEDPISRKASIISKKKSLTPTTVPPPEDNRPKIDISLVEHTSHMKGAIPVLPVCLAWFCLIMNCIAPGTGTVLSGFFCLCIGKPRFSQKDGPRQRVGSFVINSIIGFGQFFTVLFCLVGWGWSIWWGVIMLKVAKKHKKLKHLEAIEEASSRPVPVTNQNHHLRDPSRRS